MILPEGSANKGSINHTPFFSSRDCCIQMSQIELRGPVHRLFFPSAFLRMMIMHADQAKELVIKIIFIDKICSDINEFRNISGCNIFIKQGLQ